VKNLYMFYCIFDHHKKNIMRVCFAFVLSIFTALSMSCSAQQPISELKLDPTHSLLFLNKEAAANTIVQDATDGFFEKVTAGEISIQIKRPLKGDDTAENMQSEYIAFLQNDVANFTEAEIAFVSEIFKEVFSTSQNVDKNIFPSEIKLIKTSAKHYGESVYYTRENCIVIPYNELDVKNRKAFLTTMFHELFHIYSRLNPEKSRGLYKLIGFDAVGFENLKIPVELGKRVFFNPDGVDFAQKITLKTDAGTIYAIPIIYSNHVGFTKSKPDFFGYLEFNLFQVTPTDAGKWTVVTQADGFSSTVNMKKTDFFDQIKDNTHYIIHPDEVLADNFAFVLMQKNDASVGEKFSKPGKQLLLDIEAILKTPIASNNGGINGTNRR
jgi:hypothetical protein